MAFALGVADTSSLIAPLGSNDSRVEFTIGAATESTVYCAFGDAVDKRVEAQLVCAEDNKYECEVAELTGQSTISVDFGVVIDDVRIESNETYTMDYVPTFVDYWPKTNVASAGGVVDFSFAGTLGAQEDVYCHFCAWSPVSAVLVSSEGEGQTFNCAIPSIGVATTVSFDVEYKGKSVLSNAQRTTAQFGFTTFVDLVVASEEGVEVTLDVPTASWQTLTCEFGDIGTTTPTIVSSSVYMCGFPTMSADFRRNSRPEDLIPFRFLIEGEAAVDVEGVAVTANVVIPEPETTPKVPEETPWGIPPWGIPFDEGEIDIHKWGDDELIDCWEDPVGAAAQWWATLSPGVQGVFSAVMSLLGVVFVVKVILFSYFVCCRRKQRQTKPAAAQSSKQVEAGIQLTRV